MPLFSRFELLLAFPDSDAGFLASYPAVFQEWSRLGRGVAYFGGSRADAVDSIRRMLRDVEHGDKDNADLLCKFAENAKVLPVPSGELCDCGLLTSSI